MKTLASHFTRRLARLVGSPVTLTLLSLPAMGQYALVDDFEGYTTGTSNAAGSSAFTANGGPWQPRGNTGTVAGSSFIALQDDAGNRHLAFGWNGGTRSAYRAVTPIANGSTGIYYFRIRTTDATPEGSFGLSDVTTATGANDGYGDFEVQVGFTNSGGPAFGAMNGGTFQTLVPGLAINTWYDVWLVIDNATDTFDVHFGTTGDPTVLGPQVANDFSFRNGTAANDLVSFMTLEPSGSPSNPDNLSLHLDNLRLAPGPPPGATNPVTYVDATTGNTQRWDGQPFNPAPDGTTGQDNNWEVRTFGNNANVHESNTEAAENAPLLVTTLTGLVPNTRYVLYAYFWDATTGNWRLKASVDPADIDTNGTPANPADDFLPTTPLTHFAADDNAGGTATDAPAASTSIFASDPLFTQSDRTLMQASLGTATSDAGGNLAIYVDDLAGVTQVNRTWYDGVGYKLAVTLAPGADEDGDGLTNAEEATEGTDPYLADTDGDTYSDYVEVQADSDPLDRFSIPSLPGNSLQMTADGAWTWFNDERAIFHQGSLFIGYVKSNGQYGITRYDPAINHTYDMVISTSASQQTDDHNNPSITVLPDGKLMVLYSKHRANAQFYQRTSLVPLPSSAADWGPEIARPLTTAYGAYDNTYNNTYLLSGESNRIYNFHRYINFNPTITVSDDLGATWQPSIPFVSVGTGSTRPYPRYCSNGVDRIDLIYTDGHPRDFDNSVYHMYYKGDAFYKTDGVKIDDFANLPLDHQGGQKGSVIYQFSANAWSTGQGPDDWIPNARGWTWDVHYGKDGHPACVFQVQLGSDGATNWPGSRIYYYYARWTGTAWQKRFIAQAGRGIYSGESDYGGGMCIDPKDTNVIYIASNAASPFALGDINSVPLNANARFEIYRGVTSDGGLTFHWTPVTTNSDADNLRPIIPEDSPYDHTLVWFNGTYTTYSNFSARVLAVLRNDPKIKSAFLSPATHSGTLTWTSSPGVHYRITGSPHLASFPYPAASGIESQGSETSATFSFPGPLQGASKAFFRVEEQ